MGISYVQSQLRTQVFNPLNAELNPVCYLLALLGGYHILRIIRVRVKRLTYTGLV